MSARRLGALSAFTVAVALAGCRDVKPAPTCPTGLPSFGVTATATPTADARDEAPLADDRAALSFVADKRLVRTLTKRDLRRSLEVQTFALADNYYEGRRKTWRAVSLQKLLELGFARGERSEAPLDLASASFVLRCVDGYTVPFEGRRLLEDGGYVAIADADVPEWDPIGTKRDNPGPFFLVWTGKDQQNLEMHPRPYQLAAIEIAEFEATFPHVVPTGEPDGSPARRGFALFKEECIRCHAVNQEGGRVGPELNVPQSVVEYRTAAQLKAFIKNPRAFRYSGMPAHPHLDEASLDALVAYFRAMSTRKHDPNAPKSQPAEATRPR